MSTRPGAPLRRQTRLAWRASAKRNRGLLGTIVLVCAAVAAATCFLPGGSWFRGYLFGLVTMGACVLCATAVHGASGAQNTFAGQTGEESTAKAVGGFLARRRGWRAVHNLFSGPYGDVDHVVFASGGIFAIESKFTNVPWTVSNGVPLPNRGDPFGQARQGARKVQGLLRYGSERIDVEVHPVVVVWGPGAPHIESGAVDVGGVLVCEGRQHRRWVKRLKGDLHTSTVKDAHRIVMAQRQRAEGVKVRSARRKLGRWNVRGTPATH